MEGTVIKFRNYILYKKFKWNVGENTGMLAREIWSCPAELHDQASLQLSEISAHKKNKQKKNPEKVSKEEFGRIGYYKSNVF